VKERLTGAIILVILIVLLVPELLSGPKGPSAPVQAGAAPTSSEEPPLRSYTINLGDESHSRSDSAESSGPAMPQPSGPEQPTVQPGGGTTDASKAQSEPAAAVPPTSSQAPETPQARTPQSSGAQQAPSSTTASSQAPKPQASGAQQASSAQAARPGEAATPPQRTVKSTAPKPTPPASSAPPRSESPKPARAAASEKSTKASAAASTSESPPGSPARSWAVQLGVFANRENAERLALEVRVKGFKASVSPVTSGSRKLYRVRVGPTADRAAAQELQGRLKASGRPGGTVVPYS
jgi:cell division septation protein DedD